MAATGPEKVWIPPVPKTRIEELAIRIKPVMRFRRIREIVQKNPGSRSTILEVEHPRGKLRRTGSYGVGLAYYIEPVDLFSVAYTWDPKPAAPATGIRPIRDITTYHGYGYYGMFKPGIAEVLAQIPEELTDSVVAFEIIKAPETSDDLNREQEALNAGYHVATTRLYVSSKQK